MQYLIKGGNAYGSLRIELNCNEFIFARPHSLCMFSHHVQFTESKPSGFFRRLARKFSGAHLEMQQITAAEENGWLMLAPPMMGAINAIELHGNNVMVEKDAFLAADQKITTNSRLYTLDKNRFSRDAFQAVRFSGEGLLFLNAFGAIETLSLLPEQTIRLHADYLLAWEEKLQFAELDRGFLAIIGPGHLWLQTRTGLDFSEWQDGLKEAGKSANS